MRIGRLRISRQWTTLLLAAGVATLAMFICAPGRIQLPLFDTLQHIEWMGYDILFALHDPSTVDSHIVIVGYDRETERTLGRSWPPPRSYHAQVIKHLVDDGVKLIVYDVLFSDPSQPDEAAATSVATLSPDGQRGYLEDHALDEALKYAHAKGVQVILTSRIERSLTEKRRAIESPYYNDSLGIDFLRYAHEGLAEVQSDDDGYLRRMYPAMTTQGEWMPSLSCAAYTAYRGKADSTITVSPQAVTIGNLAIPRTGPTASDPVDHSEIPSTYIEFPGGLGAFPIYRFDQVYGGGEKFTPGLFRNKIVFIGVTGSQLIKEKGEGFTTAYSRFRPSEEAATGIEQSNESRLAQISSVLPGVLVQAQIFNALLYRGFITRSTPVIVWLCVFAFALTGTYYVRNFTNWRGPVILLFSCAVYLLISYLLFTLAQTYLPWMLPTVLTLAGAGSLAWVERGNLRKKWAGYVSPAVLETILRQESQMGASRVTASVIFGDIRNFTGFSEQHAPEKVVRLLNRHLARMTQIIYREGGTIDKFLGDGILVVYGAPIAQEQSVLHAVRSAWLMRNVSLEPIFDDDGSPYTLASGFGITTGPLVSGHVGSEQRHEFTIIGDTVNLASRLQGVTGKPDVIIDAPTYEIIQRHLEVESLGEVTLKGKSKPVPCFKVTAWHDIPQGDDVTAGAGKARLPASV